MGLVSYCSLTLGFRDFRLSLALAGTGFAEMYYPSGALTLTDR